MALAENQLLPQILEKRRAEIIERWQYATTTEDREIQWVALQQLKELVGAIEHAIGEYGGSRDE